MLYSWIWENEYTLNGWKEGVVVILFIEGDKAHEGNDRGMALHNMRGKTLCEIVKDRLGTILDAEEKISEGQKVSRSNSSCVDHRYT